jgi:hypothetical protein
MLGHALRDRLDTFVVPFSAEEGRPEAVDFLRSQGASVARVLQSATTINELFIMHEMLVAEPGRPSNEWAQWLMAQGDEAVPVDFAAQMTPVFGARGAGFGALFPGDLERLYAGSYGNVDVAAWKQGHAAGLDIPAEPPHFPSFVTKRQETVEGFKDFCAQIFPELLQPLRLAR